MLPITKMLINYNYSKRTDTIKYICVHDTGNTGKNAGVDNHYAYFNGGNRNASADYFVEDKKIGQFVEDHNYSWAVGDGGGKYGITNNNSVSIELCINPESDRATAINNLVDLTKHLMAKYNIPVDRVVRHYDASRKSCPNSMKANNWAEWIAFKNRLSGSVQNTQSNSNSNDNLYRVRKSWSEVSTQKGAYKDINNAISECKKHNGYKVYDKDGNQVYPEVSVSSILQKSYKENGKATVICSALNVRDNYDIKNSNVVAKYNKGESFYYDEVYITNDYVFVSYISNSGHKRYVAVKDKNTGERFANCV